MRGLNLDHLHTFADVVALGSFTAAAKRLNLTQPAISLQLRQLERRLGVRLIERIGKRATPTAAGVELLAHIRHIDMAVTAALEAMDFHSTGAVGRVRLGSGATACIYLLPDILRDLRARFPSLDIVVTTGSTYKILQYIEDNVLDLALVTLPVSDISFAITPVMTDEFVAILPADTPHLPAVMTPEALNAMPVVLHEPGASTRQLAEDWFVRAGIAIKPAMEMGNVEAIKKVVGAGLGCSMLPRMAVADQDSQRHLAVRPLSPRLDYRLGIALRHDKPLNRGLREVVATLTALADKRSVCS